MSCSPNPFAGNDPTGAVRSQPSGRCRSPPAPCRSDSILCTSMPAARATVSSTASGRRGSGGGRATPRGGCPSWCCLRTPPPRSPAFFRAATPLPGRGCTRRGRWEAAGRLLESPGTRDCFLLGLGSGSCRTHCGGAHRTAPVKLAYGIHEDRPGSVTTYTTAPVSQYAALSSRGEGRPRACIGVSVYFNTNGLGTILSTVT